MKNLIEQGNFYGPKVLFITKFLYNYEEFKCKNRYSGTSL